VYTVETTGTLVKITEVEYSVTMISLPAIVLVTVYGQSEVEVE
jgi:hypothetical protein